jgi:hypothetical protein
MKRWFRTASALSLAFALAACPPRDTRDRPDAAPEAPVREPADPSLARTTACTNAEVGYRIEYPADWRTNPGDVMPGCSLFDPGPIRIEPGTELPFDIAVAIRREPVALARLTGGQRGRRALHREDTEVDGRRAVRMTTELTEDLLRPAGSRSYRYYIDLGGEATLVAETHDAGDLDFDRKRRILDGMAATLRFTGSR